MPVYVVVKLYDASGYQAPPTILMVIKTEQTKNNYDTPEQPAPFYLCYADAQAWCDEANKSKFHSDKPWTVKAVEVI